MLKYEAKLIDPTPEQVTEALAAAADGANKRCRTRLLEIDPAKVKKSVRRCAADAEGWEMFRGGRGGVPASQVLAAWWTDAARRKHVVVRGRRVEHRESARLLHKDELDGRPPLFHAYPEYVCRRTTPAGSEVVCACGCGAVGSPQTLGWMGECCGPCSDRKDEVGPEGLRANYPGVLYGDRDPLTAVACSPDGNLVAAAEGKDVAHLWDLRTRERTTFELHALLGIDLAFSADGKYLLAAGFGLSGKPFAMIDTAKKKLPAARATEYALCDRVAAFADPRHAVVRRSAAPPNRLDVVRLPSRETVRSVEFPIHLNAQFGSMNGPIAVSRDGNRGAVGGPRVVVCDLENGTTGASIEREARSLAFTPDGGRLYVGTAPGTVTLHDAVTGRELASVIPGGTGAERDLYPSLAVDPAGGAVYAAGFRGRLHVLHPDTLEVRAAFDWHLGAVSGLAVSADGSRLFSAGGDGCVKVWPVRDLLRGVGA